MHFLSDPQRTGLKIHQLPHELIYSIAEYLPSGTQTYALGPSAKVVMSEALAIIAARPLTEAQRAMLTQMQTQFGERSYCSPARVFKVFERFSRAPQRWADVLTRGNASRFDQYVKAFCLARCRSY